MYEKKNIFDAKLIQEPLVKLLLAAANKIEREQPFKYQHVDSARVVFFTRLRIAINTYQAIMYLIATSPRDPLRDRRFVLVTPMLVRSLFEELITIVFLLHDVASYIPYLFKTGYKERWLDLQFRLEYHGAEPEWQESINQLQQQMVREAAVLQLTSREITDPDNSFGRWPQPPKMLSFLRQQHPNSLAIPFIQYMNDWVYRKLSGQTHLDRSGLVQKGIHFSIDDAKLQFGEEWESRLEDKLTEYCTEHMHLTWAILLSIASEIEAHFRFELKDRALFIWHVLMPHSDYCTEFFRRRYGQLLDYN